MDYLVFDESGLIQDATVTISQDGSLSTIEWDAIDIDEQSLSNEIEPDIEKNKIEDVNSNEVGGNSLENFNRLDTRKHIIPHCAHCQEIYPLSNRQKIPKICTICKAVLNYRCAFCKKEYKQFHGLYCHIRCKHNVTKMLTCSECSYKTAKRENLVRHIEGVHNSLSPEAYPKCFKCGEKYKNRISLREHERLCRFDLVCCNYCSFETRQRHLMRNHISAEHEDEHDLSYIEDILDDMFKKGIEMKANRKYITPCCPECKLEYGMINRKILKLCHECKNEIQYRCEICKKESKNFHTIYSHVRYKHIDPKLMNCAECHYRTNRRENLVAHMKTVHYPMIDNLACRKCGFEYKKKSSLDHHEKSCRVNLMSCKYCNYQSKYRHAMRIHLLESHGKDYDLGNLENILDVLGESQESKDVKRHITPHCPDCRMDYGTNNRSIPKSCLKCKKVLSYRCEFCFKDFEKFHSIYWHVRYKHTESTTISCSECDYETKKRCNFVRHVKLVHKPQLKTHRECTKCGKEVENESASENSKKSCDYCTCPFRRKKNNLISVSNKELNNLEEILDDIIKDGEHF